MISTLHVAHLLPIPLASPRPGQYSHAWLTGRNHKVLEPGPLPNSSLPPNPLPRGGLFQGPLALALDTLCGA